MVVLRFRLYLKSLRLASGTINQRLATVRRLAYEAADSGLLSPELTAGIRRVKGVKQLGVRAGTRTFIQFRKDGWISVEGSEVGFTNQNCCGPRSDFSISFKTKIEDQYSDATKIAKTPQTLTRRVPSFSRTPESERRAERTYGNKGGSD